MSKTALPGGMGHNGAWKSSRRPGVVHQEKKKKMWDEVQKCLRLFSQWLNWRLMRREIPHLERNRWENWQLGKMCECVFVICECSTLSALPVLLPRLSSGHTKLSLTSLWFMLRFFSPAASFVVWSIRVLLFAQFLPGGFCIAREFSRILSESKVNLSGLFGQSIQQVQENQIVLVPPLGDLCQVLLMNFILVEKKES